ncbi:MAG: sigma-70 family RNA polymerase sigma factor [Planctomycetota bacterium]
MTSPSQAAMRQELGEQLRQALSDISSTDQEIIAMRHFEDLSNREIAEALEIEQDAASIRYVRAIRRLKSILDSIPGFGVA